MTHPDNGRFTRTIVNRLWQRLMGRGIVHPVDVMAQRSRGTPTCSTSWPSTSPITATTSSSTLELIATSDVYQARHAADQRRARQRRLRLPRALRAPDDGRAVRRRRLANQWRRAREDRRSSRPREVVTPTRSVSDGRGSKCQMDLVHADAGKAAAGETATFRRQFKLPALPTKAVAVITCDNEHRLVVNGQAVVSDENWETAEVSR